MKQGWDRWDKAGLVFLACALVALVYAFHKLMVRLGPLLFPAT